MRLNRIIIAAACLLAGMVCVAQAQTLSTDEISSHRKDYRARPGFFVGVGGGVNLGFNGKPFVSRDNSGAGVGTALDVYAGLMTRKKTWGFGLGFQGLNVSDRFTEYGRKQYLYAHGDVYYQLASAFVPYLHAGVLMVQGFSPAGGIGVMTPITLSDNLSLVPNLKFTAVRGSAFSERASSVGMVVSATVGLRFDIGKEARRKRARERVEQLLPIHDTVTMVVRDTVTVKNTEYVLVQPYVPEQPKPAPLDEPAIKQREEAFNRDLSEAVLFETGSYKLTLGAKRILNEVAEYILDNPEIRTLIEGHTDDTGGDELNLRLSQNRAASVVDYLISCGVNPFKISSVGYGKARPIVPNDSPENRSRNRRVEIHFSAD